MTASRDLDASRGMDWSTLVALHAIMKPTATAIRFEDKSTTYFELDAQSTRLASWLAGRGVGVGDRVALLLTNRPDFVVGVVAAQRIGAVAVPLNFRLSSAEVDFILEDTAAVAVVTEKALRGLLTGPATPEAKLVVDDDNDLDVTRPAVALQHFSTDSAAVIIYTSGTTGLPKGAVLSHLNLQAQGLALINGWELFADDRRITLLCLPLFHVGGFTISSAFLMIGGTMVIQPSGAFDAGATLDVLARESVSSVFMVPTQWQSVLGQSADRPDLNLRVLAWGGAPMSVALLEKLNTRFPDASIVAVFGQTEVTPVAMLGGNDAKLKIGSVGRSIDTIAVRVVDEEMNDVAPGTVGELVYRGPALMLGYWQRPADTAKSFEGGWFHSGDLAYIDTDGFIYVVDRKKDMIISGGENIYSAEVESALAAHVDISEVAVIGCPDDYWGEVPVAVIVPRNAAGKSLEVNALATWLEGRLASYKRPKAVILVDALPRTASGKVQKHTLKETRLHTLRQSNA